MLLSWKVRYIDTQDRKMKDRELFLDTTTLDPALKAAVEATIELEDVGYKRDVLQYRYLFKEYTIPEQMEFFKRINMQPAQIFSVDNYIEDENGKEFSEHALGAVLTGNPNVITMPPGCPSYFVEFLRSEEVPVPLKDIILSNEDLSVLGYFKRDFQEMLNSSFYTEGPGKFSFSKATLNTSVSDEEIRSFVMIFRRFYMVNERANLYKASNVFKRALTGHPLAKYVKGAVSEYTKGLKEKISDHPYFKFLTQNYCITFTVRQLIDVYLYTRYIHQPGQEKEHEFNEYLEQVGGKRDLLFWLFLLSLHYCAIQIKNAGNEIVKFHFHYCQFHQVSHEICEDIKNECLGIGTQETKKQKRDRILNEKTEQLAKNIWEQKGCPDGGYTQFLNEARKQLEQAMKKTS